jgi:hypothetical protein
MSRALYEQDYVAWLAEQAAVMRRLAAERVNLPLDLELLAEEMDEMARELRAACASHTATIIQHLLKLQYSPAGDPRRVWENTVRAARDNLANRITTTIARELEDDLEQRFRIASKMARNDLEQHHELEAAQRLPRKCPYTLGEICDPDWWPAPATVDA